MINPLYGVKYLKLGFDRYIRYSEIEATIRCSDSSVSFYVDKGDGTKPTNARASNHHFLINKQKGVSSLTRLFYCHKKIEQDNLQHYCCTAEAYHR